MPNCLLNCYNYDNCIFPISIHFSALAHYLGWLANYRNSFCRVRNHFFRNLKPMTESNVFCCKNFPIQTKVKRVRLLSL
ncbi:hypothetical protein IC582_010516 [Cucumis melo]